MNAYSPKVSVIMPVYNGEKFLREAIDSIFAQKAEDFELIVVDDGSSDKTPYILQSYSDGRLQIITQTNKGQAAARNSGIKMSRGEYIALLDCDDRASSDRLALQIDFLDSHPHHVMVGGQLRMMTADGLPIYLEEVPTNEDIIQQELAKDGFPFLNSSIMFRRRQAIECGLYDERLRHYEDSEFIQRLSLRGKMANLPLEVGDYRITPGAVSNRSRTVLRARKKVLDGCRRGDVEKDYLDILEQDELGRGYRVDFSLYALRVGSAYLHKGFNRAMARVYLWKAVRTWPFNDRAWFNLFLCYLPQVLINSIVRIRRLLR